MADINTKQQWLKDTKHLSSNELIEIYLNEIVEVTDCYNEKAENKIRELLSELVDITRSAP